MSWLHRIFNLRSGALRLDAAQAAPLNAASRFAPWFQHSILAVCLCFLLTGCGFEPMYGDASMGGKATAMRGNILIDNIPTHEGQILKVALEDRFNPEGLNAANAQYRLNVGIQKTLIPAVVKSDGTIQRYDIRFDSNFRLYERSSPKAIFMGTLRRTGSYNVAVNANFATYEAEQDVIERLLKEMAEDYVMRISAHLAAAKPDKPKP